jgi:hypothetical protein
LTRDQFPDVLIPGVHQYNGSGANIDHYQQWRNAFTLDDTFTFSPSLVGSFRYGFARRFNYETWGGVDGPGAVQNLGRHHQQSDAEGIARVQHR